MFRFKPNPTINHSKLPISEGSMSLIPSMAPAFLVEEMKKKVDEEARAVVVMDRDAQNLSSLRFWENDVMMLACTNE